MLISVIYRCGTIILFKSADKMFLVLVSACDGNIFNLKRCVEEIIAGSLHSFFQNIPAEIKAGQFL